MKLKYLVIPTSFALASCSNEKGPENPFDAYNSTYEVIQGEVWDVSCVSCHTSGSSFARQSELALTADVSYEQLINRTPNNKAARDDGLVLVGDEGLASVHHSFLWEKINAPDIAHFTEDHPEYGSIMPLGGEYLTNGQLEFIRKWIVEGAPQHGHVADLELLADDTRFEELPFRALSPPEQGYQFHVPPFEVPPNSDREIFIFSSLENTDPVFVKEVEISMAPGSHHFILYGFEEDFPSNIEPTRDKLRDVYKDDGSYNFQTLYYTQFHQFVTGTQWPNMTYRYPEGVALKLPANYRIDLNSHYANRTDKTIEGEVYTNLHTIDESEVQHVAQILNLNNDDFLLPANKVTTLKKTFRFDEKINVFQLFSHAHEHMTEFRVYVTGGSSPDELVYITEDWEHPPILQLDPPIVLHAGMGLRLETTYNNDEDRDLTFGLRSTDEMMILFGAYYE